MYTEKIFKQIKAAMAREVRTLSLEDMSSHLEWADAHYDILKKLAEIEEMNKTREVHFPKTKQPRTISAAAQTATDTEETDDTTEASTNSETNTEDRNDGFDLEKDRAIIDNVKTPENKHIFPIGYRFTYTQKASGGVLEAINYPFAEQYANKHGLQNGNIIELQEVKGYSYDNTPQYHFEIIDDTEIPHPSIGYLYHGIVEEMAGRLVVMKTMNGKFKIDENNAVLYLQDKDINKMGVKKGDVIDGRYYKSTPDRTFRVSYIHETEAMEEKLSVEQRRLQYRQNNSSENEAGESMLSRMDLEPLVNKRILLIGLSSRATHFKQMLASEEGRKLDLVHMTGDESKDKIRSEVAHADVVLLATQMNSHDSSKYAAAVCKQFGVSVTDTHSDGLYGVLNDAKEFLATIAA